MAKFPVSPPSMRSDDVELALAELVGSLPAPQGLVITVRRHEEYEVLIEKIRSLEAQLHQKDYELHSMATYAPLYLGALDELRIARKLLDQLGEDTSFITSLRLPR